MTPLRHQYELLAAVVTKYDIIGSGAWQACIPCSTIFSIKLQTEILSTETSDFLKQIIILRAFDSVLILLGYS